MPAIEYFDRAKRSRPRRCVPAIALAACAATAHAQNKCTATGVMAGAVRPGGQLTGRITGSHRSDGRPYSWDLAFDVTLPTKEAASRIIYGK